MILFSLVLATARFVPTDAAALSAALLRSHMDTSVKPGDDFFTYANGAWTKTHPIPATEVTWGIYDVVRNELSGRLRSISERSATSNAPQGSDQQKVGDFWSTGMDEAKAEQVGLTPLKPELDKIDAISSVNDALDVAFELQKIGIDAFFSFDVSQNEKNSNEMVVHLEQGGLGLPERAYYTDDTPDMLKVRQEYVKHLGGILGLAGETDADAPSKVLAFETSIAQASRKIEDLRDPDRNYNKMAIGDVHAKLTPSIDWDQRLGAFHLHPKSVIVGQPEFFTGTEKLLAATPVDTLRDYLRFHLISRFAPYLNKEVGDMDFHFYHQVLNGAKEQQPRWKRVIAAENGAIGFLLGKVFVKDYFPPSAKKRYSDLVESFRKAYSGRIDRLTWMSPATKAKAHIKLNALHKKVGYPDKWKDYSKLTIGRNSFCENMMNATKWGFDDMLSKYGKPVDRTEWGMTPQTDDAYYDSSNNEIVLPAAAFTIPGLTDSQVDEALIYGFAGASTIGHEMTHGFDDEGRKFDSKGNLAEWWTKQDGIKFDARAQVMIKEFNSFSPLPGMHINGKASLGENIADYGGLLIGIDAFKTTGTYKRGGKVHGLTPMQRFFLGYALSWMESDRAEYTRNQLLSDVHSPAKWRVIGPLSNIPAFYAAFGIKPGQPMWRKPDQRVNIW